MPASLWFSTMGTQQPEFWGKSAKLQILPTQNTDLQHAWAHGERLSPKLFLGMDLYLGEL